MRLSRRSLVLASAAFAACRSPAVVSRTVRRVTTSLPVLPTVDGAGVALNRVIGQPALRHLDPFIMLDRFHSSDPNDYVRGFPDHPHRGFETVTVMLEGRFRHRDSKGNHGIISGGAAQWMTAGKGIVHSEMPDQTEGLLSGFQLWINLPRNEKLCAQHYEDITADKIAEGNLAAGTARVISGDVEGLKGPLPQRSTEPTLMTLALITDRPFELDLPKGHAAFVFVHQGDVEIGPDGSKPTPASTVTVLEDGNRIRLRALSAPSTVLIAAGKPLNEPIVQRGPFVMNTDAEIAQAFADYRAGTLDRT
ncbi:MAG: pirin family protein [Myxococcaceae bacterium]